MALESRTKCHHGAIDQLEKHLSTLNVFLNFLQLGHKRIDLHKMFEFINGTIIAQRTGTTSQEEVTDFHLTNNSEPKQLSEILQEAFVSTIFGSNPAANVVLGLNLASFLMDSGWYVAATKVLFSLEDCFKDTISPGARNEISTKLLHAFSEYRQFDRGGEVLKKLSIFTSAEGKPRINSSSSELCEISNYFYWQSLFPDAHEFGMRAIKSISALTPSRVAIDVLRQAGKANVVRRQFSLAHLLLCEALLYAQEIFGKHHLRYADCLMDFAFYLLHVDEVGKSVQAYQEALTIREKILGHHNLLVASSQRVLALILEEIAIDDQVGDKKASEGMLAHAEKLHLSAVTLSTKAFGEKNVQTAKHYGNLGRLYQTMERYSEAEQMHLKAIQIKENLLGRDD